MARRKEEVQIKDQEGDLRSVEVLQLSVPDSLKVMTRIMRIVGKPLGAVISSSMTTGKEKESEQKPEVKGKEVVKSVLDNKLDLESIMGHLAENMDEEIVISTIIMLLPYIFVDGKKMRNLESFDNYGVFFLLKVVGKSLEVNFSDFFGGLLDAGAK